MAGSAHLSLFGPVPPAFLDLPPDLLLSDPLLAAGPGGPCGLALLGRDDAQLDQLKEPFRNLLPVPVLGTVSLRNQDQYSLIGQPGAQAKPDPDFLFFIQT